MVCTSPSYLSERQLLKCCMLLVFFIQWHLNFTRMWAKHPPWKADRYIMDVSLAADATSWNGKIAFEPFSKYELTSELDLKLLSSCCLLQFWSCPQRCWPHGAVILQLCGWFMMFLLFGIYFATGLFSTQHQGGTAPKGSWSSTWQSSARTLLETGMWCLSLDSVPLLAPCSDIFNYGYRKCYLKFVLCIFVSAHWPLPEQLAQTLPALMQSFASHSFTFNIQSLCSRFKGAPRFTRQSAAWGFTFHSQLSGSRCNRQ